MKILKEVLADIKPSKEDEETVNDLIGEFLARLNKNLKKVGAKAVLGGSGAKGTWLKGAHDADVFAMFGYNKYKAKSDELSGILAKALKGFKVEKLHGSRDYFQTKQKLDGESFTFEIIPILDITKPEQAMNITDISPLHAKWVSKQKKEVLDGVRLMKQFCKAQGVYGAESYIKGFSGYVVEILTAHYGSFRKFVNAAAKWEKQVIVDTAKHHKNVLMEVNKSKITGPLVVIDPVQAGRNAAAALSEKNFDNFIESVRKFVKKPSKKFFEIDEFSVDELARRKGNLITVEAVPKSGTQDVVGGKLLKVFEFVSKGLGEFNVKDKGWDWDGKVVMWWIVDEKKLDAYREQPGPPAKMKDAVKEFKKKHKKCSVKKGRVFAKVKRKHTDALSAVKSLIKEKYVKERVKSIK